MLKIGVVGSSYDALPFSALGFEVHETDSAAGAAAEIDRMQKSGEFAAIFAVGTIPDEIKTPASPRDRLAPVILLPGGKGAQTPAGADSGNSDVDAFVGGLRDASRRALGIDIVSGMQISQ